MDEDEKKILEKVIKKEEVLEVLDLKKFQKKV